MNTNLTVALTIVNLILITHELHIYTGYTLNSLFAALLIVSVALYIEIRETLMIFVADYDTIMCWSRVVCCWCRYTDLRKKFLSPNNVRGICSLMIILCLLYISSLGLGLSVCCFILLTMGRRNLKIDNQGLNNTYLTMFIPYISQNMCGGGGGGQQGSNPIMKKKIS